MSWPTSSLVISVRSVLAVVRRPAYAALALMLALVFFLVLRYFFSLSTLAVILTNPAASLAEKISFIVFGLKPSSLGELLVLAGDPIALSLLIVALLQGIAIAVLIFVRRRGGYDKKARGTASGFTASLVGSGCVACGGSILYPLLASFGSGLSAAFSRFIGLAVGVIAVGLIVYALHGLGLVAARIFAGE